MFCFNPIRNRAFINSNYEYKMNKLIPMTDFVLNYKYQNDKPISGQEFYKLRSIANYARFLKQPLKLGMFIPTDEDGNVLDAPGYFEASSFTEQMQYESYVDEYQQAQQKVLFKGFENSSNGDKFHNIIHKNKFLTFDKQYNNFTDSFDKRYTKIEDLVHLDLELTESALKQIQ